MTFIISKNTWSNINRIKISKNIMKQKLDIFKTLKDMG